MAKKTPVPKTVEALTHSDASRTNIPTAEHQTMMVDAEAKPTQVSYIRGVKGLEDEKEKRNRDLDPQLVWRGKDSQDWSDLVVAAPPLYIQEKVHPKVLIDDLRRQTEADNKRDTPTLDLFGDFNGLPHGADKTEFYQHDQNWSNRMILGDSLQVMASLAEREGLRGKVQCIYFDPPYGIKFNSNFQWSTTSRDVKDGNTAHITREPEQVKAFRDTWRDGIHSYLTYLRDRLTVARDLLTDSGSIFLQIGDENVHRVRALIDEVFGETNHVIEIKFRTTSNRTADFLPSIFDTIVVYAKDKSQCKFRRPYKSKEYADVSQDSYGCIEIDRFEWRRLTKSEKEAPKDAEKIGHLFGLGDLTSSHEYIRDTFEWQGGKFDPKKRYWSTSLAGLRSLGRANRLCDVNGTLRYKRIFNDTPASPLTNIWDDTGSGSQTEERTYVVQTVSKAIERCLLMATDPGDLVLDPTCGSGTTATVAEQWGRRWITIDTSRVALALARARVMGARYPFYHLADSVEGQKKESEVTKTPINAKPVAGIVSKGFVYERVPHITLKSIANNAEIDVIHAKYEQELSQELNNLSRQLKALASRRQHALGTGENIVIHAVPLPLEEWTVPRQVPYQLSDEDAKLVQDVYENELKPKTYVEYDDPFDMLDNMTYPELPPYITFAVYLRMYWDKRIARQKEIDASIAARAEYEYLYDKPYEDKKKVRVAGPFTVESLSPHRILSMDENDEFVQGVAESKLGYGRERDFVEIILDNLKVAGVQQSHKADKIVFSSLAPWPGDSICADGRYMEGDVERRAAVFIGPEFGTVTRPDLVAAARESAEAGFDTLISCAFAYEAHVSDLSKMGSMPILKARMNADLHMAEDLKTTDKGNLFVVFGEPDLEILDAGGNQIKVKINGVDVFHPNSGEVRSDSIDGIACWFIDTDYNEESFFVRQAYFLGANDPYSALKTTLKAEINEEAWESLHSDVSRPFDKPTTGRIAVKVINHLGDEVMKVFRVN